MGFMNIKAYHLGRILFGTFFQSSNKHIQDKWRSNNPLKIAENKLVSLEIFHPYKWKLFQPTYFSPLCSSQLVSKRDHLVHSYL